MVQRFPRGHLKDNEHTYIFSKIPLMIKGLVVALLMLNYKWPISRFSYFNHSKEIWRCSKLLISSFPHSNQSNKNLETLYIANLQISQFQPFQQKPEDALYCRSPDFPIPLKTNKNLERLFIADLQISQLQPVQKKSGGSILPNSRFNQNLEGTIFR
jgi:Leucine-rich repeat (LRR) protein